MKLGVNSVLFSDYDLEIAFKYVKAAGYDGIEVSAAAGRAGHMHVARWKQWEPRIKQLSEQYRLPVLAMQQPQQESELMEYTMQAAVAAGIPIINCDPGGRMNNEESFRKTVDSLRRLAHRAESYGLRVCVKPHVGSAIWNAETLMRAAEEIPSEAFGIDMDPSHIFRAGEDPVETLKQVMPRVRHVHIRDCHEGGRGEGSPEEQINGRGDIDLVGLIGVLCEHGYDGPINLEVRGAAGYSIEQCCMIAAEARGHLRASIQAGRKKAEGAE